MFHEIMTIVLPVGWIICLYWIRHRENKVFRAETLQQQKRISTLETDGLALAWDKGKLRAENCILQAVHRSDMAVIEQRNNTIKSLDIVVSQLMNGDPDIVDYDVVSESEDRRYV